MITTKSIFPRSENERANSTDSLADEKQQAEVYSGELAAYCDPDCVIASLVRVSPGVWKVEEDPQGDAPNFCINIHIDSFRPLSDRKFTGIAEATC